MTCFDWQKTLLAVIPLLMQNIKTPKIFAGFLGLSVAQILNSPARLWHGSKMAALKPWAMW